MTLEIDLALALVNAAFLLLLLIPAIVTIVRARRQGRRFSLLPARGTVPPLRTVPTTDKDGQIFPPMSGPGLG